MDLALVEPSEGDRIINEDGVRFYVQPLVEDYYDGAQLDYDKGFLFNHPDMGSC